MKNTNQAKYYRMGPLDMRVRVAYRVSEFNSFSKQYFVCWHPKQDEFVASVFVFPEISGAMISMSIREIWGCSKTSEFQFQLS